MRHITAGARSLSLLIDLNVDRMIYAATIVAALMAGAFFSSL